MYRDYEAELRKRQCVDFDDLLLLPLRLFEQHRAVLQHYQQKYHYVLVDEYQDTNTVQMKLAKMLATPRNNIMAVGDDDQSIYAWRGANSENVLNFGRSFKGCTTVILDTNYRSTRQIVDAATVVVANNRKRKQKVVKAAAGEGDLIEHYRGEDETDEALWVARSIKQRVAANEFRYSDFAILVRTNAMMRRFEEEMRHDGVPYRVIGAMSFFDRREVKDLVAYMRFLANPDDELSMSRVLKVPDSGISKPTLTALEELAARRRITLYRALEHFEDAGGIDGLQHEKCERFRTWARQHIAMAASGSPAEAVHSSLSSRGYRETLERACKDEEHGQDRLDNIDELLHGLAIYEKRDRNPTLAGYVQQVALQFEDDKKEDESRTPNAVTMLTLHKSKGLEFPVVYLVGLDDSVFPSPRTVEEGNLEEERRLFYVGMTRAMKKLVLSWPHLKLFRAKELPVTPTRFIREIPEEFLDGPLGEQQVAAREQVFTDFFKQMKQQFGSAQDAEEAAPDTQMPEVHETAPFARELPAAPLPEQTTPVAAPPRRRLPLRSSDLV